MSVGLRTVIELFALAYCSKDGVRDKHSSKIAGERDEDGTLLAWRCIRSRLTNQWDANTEAKKQSYEYRDSAELPPIEAQDKERRAIGKESRLEFDEEGKVLVRLDDRYGYGNGDDRCNEGGAS
mmetsp:Transcript_68190/g.134692  ORF Transcript_68190/g.134692 Transcript_68190/m.134692 type:complete len:124 (-) Transcript_68190:1272-1643(-)